MGIETRRNRHSYYYRKVRRNGRIVSEYAGSGELAHLFAAFDRSTRAARALEARHRRELARADRAVERDAWGLLADCEQLAALALLAAGYRRHRGQWRKRRPMGKNLSPSQQLIENLERQAAKAAAERKRAEQRAGLPPLPAADDESPEAVRAILKRADRSDATAEDMAALRRILDKRGRALADSGNPLRLALNRELAEMPATGLGRELIGRDLDARRLALGYTQAPPLERPLIDHLLLCELRLGLVEQSYSVVHQQSMSLDQGDYWERRLSNAQARYLRALESLARVRRVRVELLRVAPDGSAEAVAVEGPGS